MFKRHMKRAAGAVIDDRTIQRALRVLELWHEENPEKYIRGIVHRDGRARFVILDKETEDESE